LASRLDDLEPADMPNGRRRLADGGLDGILDAGFGGADYLDEAVNMIGHGLSSRA
jgi:hypothetical protein